MLTKELIDSIKLHEGKRLEAYQDHLGVWTIGYGTNLQVLRIDDELAEKWLIEKLEEIENALSSIQGFAEAGVVRQSVLIEMGYQLGVSGCLKFQSMWAAVRKQDWWAAASEMLDSKWAKQTPKRVQTLSKRMRYGTWDGKRAIEDYR